MNKHLYEKLAITNIRKNGKLYLPYLLTIIGSMMFYYILTSIANNPTIYDTVTKKEAFKGAEFLCQILQAGSFVAALFAFIFLLYANSFVLKHQKKQLGLYRVLGMERKHIARIVTTEVVFIFAIGLVTALFFGILFDKLMLVLLFKIIGQTAQAGFHLSLAIVLRTLALAAGIAALVLLRSMLSVLSAKDVELLKSDKMGEQEPKNRPLYTLVGVVFLAIGYGIALHANNGGSAIMNFFPAALCVMAATYILFTAGSITLLKLLKKNKNYYYTTRHFISVSSLLYRMKQNANGLATICILSTAAIVVLSAGASLYANGERSINEQFPRMIQFATPVNEKDIANELLQNTLSECSMTAENAVTCTFAQGLFVKTENGIASLDSINSDSNSMTDLFTMMPDTFLLTLDEYNRFHQANETLSDTEILLYASDNFYTDDTLTYLDVTYKIKGTADHDCLDFIADTSMSLFSKLLIVVPNDEILQKFMGNQSLSSQVTWTGLDLSGSDEEILAFYHSLSEEYAANGITYELSAKQQEQDYFYSTYGGILFIGVVLGILFILSTAMIIYYKQISEGYEDKERFLIMQKVGLSKQEIKKSIHSQIMLVFFLPLAAAVIHSAVALKIVANCLRMVILVHMPTFILSTAIICILFPLVYMVVYKITSKEYYNIVNE